MKYWKCVNDGGTPYSYCGLNEICCVPGTDPSSSSIINKLVTMSANNPAKVSNCGKKGFDTNREGIADPGEWAWHVAILEKPQDLYVCGASLLDELWVLTAAHCVDDYQQGNKLKVRVGEHDVSTLNEPIRHDEYDVIEVIVHPMFNNNTLANDIALVRLSEPVRKKGNINIICLPENDTFTDQELLSTKCIVTGWGRRAENSEHSLILKEVPVPIWKQQECETALKKQFGNSYKLPLTNLCAGEEKNDACDGDGGGPLVCEKDQSWHQVGIVSFGIGCGRADTPGVYTRVASYSEWIYSAAIN
jgi:secreted trypsin-like serine protease